VKYLKSTCVTWQGIDYKLTEDGHDSFESCRSVIICEITVHLLVIVQNNKRRTVSVIKIHLTVPILFHTTDKHMKSRNSFKKYHIFASLFDVWQPLCPAR